MYNQELEHKIEGYLKQYVEITAESKFYSEFNKLMLALTTNYIKVYAEVLQREIDPNIEEVTVKEATNYLAARLYAMVVADNALIAKFQEDHIPFLEKRGKHLNDFLDLMKFEPEEEMKFFNFINMMASESDFDKAVALRDIGVDMLDKLNIRQTDSTLSLSISSFERCTADVMRAFMSGIYPHIIGEAFEL